MSRRIRETHHVGLDGVPIIGDPEILEEATEQVACAWCASVEDVAPIVSIDGQR